MPRVGLELNAVSKALIELEKLSKIEPMHCCGFTAEMHVEPKESVIAEVEDCDEFELALLGHWSVYCPENFETHRYDVNIWPCRTTMYDHIYNESFRRSSMINQLWRRARSILQPPSYRGEESRFMLEHDLYGNGMVVRIFQIKHGRADHSVCAESRFMFQSLLSANKDDIDEIPIVERMLKIGRNKFDRTLFNDSFSDWHDQVVENARHVKWLG